MSLASASSTLSPASRQALEQAIDWYARQCSGSFADDEQHAFRHWLLASPAHHEAWQVLQQRLQHTLAPLAHGPTRQALAQPRSTRRTLLRGALCMGGLALGSTLLTRPGMPLQRYAADLRTGIAERKRFTLPDGSSLLLNADSAVNLDFAGQRRQVRLLEGGLLGELLSDARRPFGLTCRFGQASLEGGRCTLVQTGHYAEFHLLQGSATVVGNHGARLALVAGQGARLGPEGVQLLVSSEDPLAWTLGMLRVRDRTLDEVVTALRPYHHGWLRVADDIAGLRISGMFYLDDSQRALTALSEVLPIRVTRHLGWWTRLERA